MASKTTRRELLRAGVTGAAAVAAGAAVAQDTKAEVPVDTSAVEAQLAKPLSDPAKKLLKGAVRNVANAHKERLKFKLPENSEPCTIFVASAVVTKR
jgi:hypothetical protein